MEGFKLFEKNFPNKIELEKKLYSNKPNANFKLSLTMEFNPKNPAKTIIILCKYYKIRKNKRIPIEKCRLHFRCY